MRDPFRPKKKPAGEASALSSRQVARAERVARATALFAELSPDGEPRAEIVERIAVTLNVVPATIRQYLRHPDASPSAKPAGAGRKRRADRISDEDHVAALLAWRRRTGCWPNSTHWQPSLLAHRPGANSRRWLATWEEGWVGGDGMWRSYPYASKIEFARLRAEARRRWSEEA